MQFSRRSRRHDYFLLLRTKPINWISHKIYDKNYLFCFIKYSILKKIDNSQMCIAAWNQADFTQAKIIFKYILVVKFPKSSKNTFIYVSTYLTCLIPIQYMANWCLMHNLLFCKNVKFDSLYFKSGTNLKFRHFWSQLSSVNFALNVCAYCERIWGSFRFFIASNLILTT